MILLLILSLDISQVFFSTLKFSSLKHWYFCCCFFSDKFLFLLYLKIKFYLFYLFIYLLELLLIITIFLFYIFCKIFFNFYYYDWLFFYDLLLQTNVY